MLRVTGSGHAARIVRPFPALILTRFSRRGQLQLVILGIGAVFFGIILAHTLIAGSCDTPSGVVGAVPTTAKACRRVAGTWIPASSFGYVAYIATRVVSLGLIVAGSVTIVLGLISAAFRAAKR